MTGKKGIVLLVYMLSLPTQRAVAGTLLNSNCFLEQSKQYVEISAAPELRIMIKDFDDEMRSVVDVLEFKRKLNYDSKKNHVITTDTIASCLLIGQGFPFAGVNDVNYSPADTEQFRKYLDELPLNEVGVSDFVLINTAAAAEDDDEKELKYSCGHDGNVLASSACYKNLRIVLEANNQTLVDSAPINKIQILLKNNEAWSFQLPSKNIVGKVSCARDAVTNALGVFNAVLNKAICNLIELFKGTDKVLINLTNRCRRSCNVLQCAVYLVTGKKLPELCAVVCATRDKRGLFFNDYSAQIDALIKTTNLNIQNIISFL